MNRLKNHKQINRVVIVAAIMVVVTEIVLFNDGILGVDGEVFVVVIFVVPRLWLMELLTVTTSLIAEYFAVVALGIVVVAA